MGKKSPKILIFQKIPKLSTIIEIIPKSNFMNLKYPQWRSVSTFWRGKERSTTTPATFPRIASDLMKAENFFKVVIVNADR